MTTLVRDSDITPFPLSACGRVISGAFTLDELPSMLEAILSNKDEGDGTPSAIILSLSEVDAQNLVDVISEALEILDLSLRIRNRCLKALYKICERYAILPKSLQIPICYDRLGFPVWQGGYADVWKGKHCGKNVAVKVLRTPSRRDLQNITRRFCKEVVAWKALQHPNVLPLIGVTMSEFQFAMVSEWMENSNINEFLTKNPGADRLGLLVDVANGLIYMHGESIIHGDLKGVNILIDRDGHARLADFGLSTIMSDPSYQLFSSTETGGGTQRWMGPELIRPQRFGLPNSRPTISSDCYALGMVVYEVISGNQPFSGEVGPTVLMMVLDGERPPRDGDFPDILWDMVQRCWMAQPSDRPNIKEVLQCFEKVIELLRPPPPVDETTTTGADNLKHVNLSLDVGIPLPAVKGCYCSGSRSYMNLCVPCSVCGRVGHATPWQRFPNDVPRGYPSTPDDPVPLGYTSHYSQIQPREEWLDPAFASWGMDARDWHS